MEQAYIGTVKKGDIPGRPDSHNKGQIYELQKTGVYKCDVSGLTLSPAQIEHDVQCGYLIPLTVNTLPHA